MICDIYTHTLPFHKPISTVNLFPLLGEFLESRGVSPSEFERLCTDALQGPSEGEGGHKEFVEVLMASVDYGKVRCIHANNE